MANYCDNCPVNWLLQSLALAGKLELTRIVGDNGIAFLLGIATYLNRAHGAEAFSRDVNSYFFLSSRAKNIETYRLASWSAVGLNLRISGWLRSTSISIGVCWRFLRIWHNLDVFTSTCKHVFHLPMTSKNATHCQLKCLRKIVLVGFRKRNGLNHHNVKSLGPIYPKQQIQAHPLPPERCRISDISSKPSHFISLAPPLSSTNRTIADQPHSHTPFDQSRILENDP